MERKPLEILADPARLDALRGSELLDSPAEPRFDRLTRLASRMLEAPIALVSLVDDQRQFFKSCVGLSEPLASTRQTPLTHSFCKHAVISRAPLIISDARQHPLVRDNPATSELGVVAYAGIPLISKAGFALGSFCVIDIKPRDWTVEQIDILKDLAASATTEIELTRSLAELNESQERLRLALAASDVGLWEWNIAPDAMVCTDQCKALFGLSAQTPFNYQAWSGLIHPADKPGMMADMTRAIESNTPVHLEYRVIWPTGTVRWLNTRGQPFTNEQGQVVRLTGATVDVTDRKRNEVELRRARDAAESANNAKDRFLAVLSHELRTPLTPALMIATLMAENPALPANTREDARTIQRNINLQTRLIDDLLDVTRIENGKLALRHEPVDLKAVIADCIAMLAAQATAKGVHLTFAPRALHSAAIGDGGRLRQVFGNLLLNALKFTPAGGNIEVTTSDRAPFAAKTNDAHAPAEHSVVISISDTGIGVEPHLLGQIFKPFEQGSRAITNEFSGLGLGLAISRGIVEAHGGTISAVSEGRGKGTTMVVELPSSALPVIAAAIPSAPSAPVAGLNILLVDDHADTLQAMSRLLRSRRHRVITANSVATALAAADCQTFDLLISDIGLPDGTGLELMRQLLLRHPIQGIALTGYGTELDVEKSQAAGFITHLTKPINFRHVEDAIQQLASQHAG